jgi:hypothetical protein
MASRKKRIPKKGDHVKTPGHNGAFVVSGVDSDIESAELKHVGSTLALSTIPWRALTFLDELDESQGRSTPRERSSGR